LLPRFFGITNTLSPVLRLPPEAADDVAPEEPDVAALDDDELLDEPQAAKPAATTAASAAEPSRNRPDWRWRVCERPAWFCFIRRLLW
jgi:hypothetical protein